MIESAETTVHRAALSTHLIEHGFSGSESTLKIHIRNEGEQLVVLNNKTGTPSKTSSHKVGLNNIRKRYSFFTAQEIKVTDEDYFEVRLPILKDA